MVFAARLSVSLAPARFKLCVSRLVVFAIGSFLIATGACGEVRDLSSAAATPTAESLLAGAKPGSNNFHATVGFRLTQNTIQLNAQPGSASSVESFVLDSGAPMTIAPRLARELGLESLANVTLAGPEGGRLTVPVTRLPEIGIAGIEFQDVGAVVDWVEPPSELACLSTAGLMGASMMQAAIWQIDFQSGTIAITDSLSKLPGLPDAMRIPFKRSDAAGSPRISVGVSDASDVSLLVDLGFNGSIAIPTALLEQSGDRIADTAPAEEGGVASTVFGEKSSVVRIARMRELRLGDLRLEDFPAVTGSAVSDFHVGIEFFRHFRVTVDWLQNDLYLELRDNKSALYHDFSSYGFSSQLQGDGLVVGAVWRGSAADRAGMKPGDRLLEVGGIDTRIADFPMLCKLKDAMGLFGSNRAPVSVTWMHEGRTETLLVDRVPLL